jgi:hypothetical protein
VDRAHHDLQGTRSEASREAHDLMTRAHHAINEAIAELKRQEAGVTKA